MSQKTITITASVHGNHTGGQRHRAGHKFTTEPQEYELTQHEYDVILADSAIQIHSTTDKKGTAPSIDDLNKDQLKEQIKAIGGTPVNGTKDELIAQLKDLQEEKAKADKLKIEDPEFNGKAGKKKALIDALKLKGKISGTDFDPEASEESLERLLASD